MQDEWTVEWLTQAWPDTSSSDPGKRATEAFEHNVSSTIFPVDRAWLGLHLIYLHNWGDIALLSSAVHFAQSLLKTLVVLRSDPDGKPEGAGSSLA